MAAMWYTAAMAVRAKTWNRRQFVQTCGAVTVGFMAYRRAFAGDLDVLAAATAARGYGPLVSDPEQLIDLPQGFSARIVARAGEEMDDGFFVPALPDAMGTFPGPDGTTLIVCNHEGLHVEDGPFGTRNQRLARTTPDKLFDFGSGQTPCPGGTTTIVWDTRNQARVQQHLSLAGTLRNCAGGVTPWGSWITCEETVLTSGPHEQEKLVLQRDHGWCFDVPASADMTLADPRPLKAMGRFMHEAVAVDPRTGIVYLTEDRDDGLLYRFLPERRDDLHAGGRLQALALDNGVGDSCNWPDVKESVAIGERMRVRWIDMDDVESPGDDLRQRGRAAGACRFARAEGMWMGRDEVFFVCTDGGRKQIGQVFRYLPSRDEGTPAETKSPGRLDLFIEPNDPRRVQNPDNITVSPWGDIIICEDTGGNNVRLVGVTPDGALYTFARSRRRGEFAGATFSPDGGTLFVNMQNEGLTLAIAGPWKHHALGRKS
jgi:secreted PhoX family phosphatase